MTVNSEAKGTWGIDLPIKVHVSQQDKIESMTDSWRNVQSWLNQFDVEWMDVKYEPNLYVPNPELGYRHIKLLTIAHGKEKFHFYEIEPHNADPFERFECYKEIGRPEKFLPSHFVTRLFVDSNIMLPVLMLYCLSGKEPDKLHITYCINKWVRNHFHNLLHIHSGIMCFTTKMYDDIDERTPTLELVPYDNPH